MISVVVVDDEPPARRKLRHLLSAATDFEIVGEAGLGGDAVALLSRLQPQIVFLDIHMPDCSGFDVLEALSPLPAMHVVFVTAFDNFAIKAFEVHAVDYLLKPVQPSRFVETIARLRNCLKNDLPAPDLHAISNEFASRAQRILIQEKDRCVFLEVRRIEWIESARNYACIHSLGRTYVTRTTLDALAQKLAPPEFIRINRSEIVNASQIAQVRANSTGDQKVLLRDGTELTWSRRYRTIDLADLAL